MRFLSADGRRIQNSESGRHFAIKLDSFVKSAADRTRKLVGRNQSLLAVARARGRSWLPSRTDPLRELTDLGKRVYRNARPPRYAKSSLTRYTGRYKLSHWARLGRN